MPVLTVADLTQTTLDGNGVFDALMRANKAHLDAEFDKNRIKGSEYATVYLGSLAPVLQTSLQFLLQKDELALKSQLLAQQIILAGVEVQKAQAELAIIQASVLKVPAEIALLQAQAAMSAQQKLNLIDELVTAGLQRTKLSQETVNLVAQGLQITAQTAIATQQKLNLVDELVTAGLQRSKLTQETTNLVTQELHLRAQTLMVTQQKINAEAEALNIPKQGAVLVAQECKLRADFDLVKSDTLKSGAEVALLTQKNATEKAQTTALGVDDNSVIGKQKLLYGAQTAGYSRDAEQKAAKLMIDTWNVRRTSDPTSADITPENLLTDPKIGKVVLKMLQGVGAEPL